MHLRSGSVELEEPGAAAVSQQRIPLGPGALAIFVLQTPDQREALAGPDTACLQLQRAVVIKQLCHLADTRECVTLAHHTAQAAATHGVGGLRTGKFDRCTTARAR